MSYFKKSFREMLEDDQIMFNMLITFVILSIIITMTNHIVKIENRLDKIESTHIESVNLQPNN